MRPRARHGCHLRLLRVRNNAAIRPTVVLLNGNPGWGTAVPSVLADGARGYSRNSCFRWGHRCMTRLLAADRFRLHVAVRVPPSGHLRNPRHRGTGNDCSPGGARTKAQGCQHRQGCRSEKCEQPANPASFSGRDGFSRRKAAGRTHCVADVLIMKPQVHLLIHLPHRFTLPFAVRGLMWRLSRAGVS